MRKLTLAILVIAACWFADAVAHAAQLKVPESVVAGAGLTLPTTGSGSATFILLGPGSALKRAVRLGEDIQIEPAEVRDAGRYLAILSEGDRSTSAVFWVTPAPVARLSFFARPSRLPVAVSNGIGGVVYPFDKFYNLVLAPQPVTFRLTVGEGAPLTRTITTRNGVAWTSMDSSSKGGSAQFVASVGEVTERRVVQQVPSDPCNLRIRAERSKNGVEVVTDPIHDCSGNPVPDGTIVTFSATSPQGRSTVDARVKKDVARAEFPALTEATISVASGVVMGNEIRWGGRP